MRDENNNIINMYEIDEEHIRIQEKALPNCYMSYYIDDDCTEIMTLDTLVKTEMARRELNLKEFCKFLSISAPVIIKLRYTRPSEYVYLKLAAHLGYNQQYLEKLPITSSELRERYKVENIKEY